MTTVDPHVIALCETVQRVAQAGGNDVYLVGGYVRDIARGSISADADLDFMVAGDARPLALRVAEVVRGTCTTHDRFFTAKVSGVSGFGLIQELDFASARTEVYPKPAALPIVTIGSVEDDLRRRDFTINAMALQVGNLLSWARSGGGEQLALLDPFEGRVDLTARCIRILHEQSFIDDPTRCFRAVRYASRLQFALAPETLQAFRAAVARQALRALSHQRIINELQLIMLERDAAAAFTFLGQERVLDIIPGFDIGSVPALAAAAACRSALGCSEEILPLRDQLFLLLLSAVALTRWSDLPGFFSLRKARGSALQRSASDSSSATVEALFVRACGIGCAADTSAQRALQSLQLQRGSLVE